MSLVARVESIAESLPVGVADVLKEIAGEVESHKAIFDEVGKLVPPAEPALQGAEEVAAVVTQAATGTSPSTSESSADENPPTAPSGASGESEGAESNAQAVSSGNSEQRGAHEPWPEPTETVA